MVRRARSVPSEAAEGAAPDVLRQERRDPGGAPHGHEKVDAGGLHVRDRPHEERHPRDDQEPRVLGQTPPPQPELAHSGDRGYILRVPYGVTLVIGTWNYPFQLTLVPVAGAIAAGNCVVIKPSEISSYSAAKIAELIPQYLDPECYAVVNGGSYETDLLLDHKFDYIFYTGSIGIGRKIHAKANKHLTPVTLELGGKSPVYIDDTVDYAITAKRILWGKCMNMGQTCVAPDYIVCTQKVASKLIPHFPAIMHEWYGDNWKAVPDLARIVNKKHFNRVLNLIKTASGQIIMGGETDESDLWIKPTIIVGVKPEDPIMNEEVFGPVLPIMILEESNDCGLEQAIEFINSRPWNPLCLYCFSVNPHVKVQLQDRTQTGNMAFNDTIVQFVIDELPFGGVGSSGMGSYHGKYTFNTFTHERPVVLRDFSFLGDKVGIIRYPPYNKFKINFLSFMLWHWKKFNIFYFEYVPHFICFMLGLLSLVVLDWIYGEGTIAFKIYNAFANRLV
ncbi:Aldehyde dehydrogenase family 3 member B1 [Orchesella cincta]|uniref:Aldehyde dehydrogenase family 3 member B1 n=1 Tax=Orchesella cincta TaxID=48709 RepID=A0A1D2MN49_ORCCI|nr:Aldehyde dehydrogenase family 3 member B1 [Orchesella cincta]